jgi:DNA-binding Xre family transcriptional regulator
MRQNASLALFVTAAGIGGKLQRLNRVVDGWRSCRYDNYCPGQLQQRKRTMAKKKREPELLSQQLTRIVLDSELTQYRISKLAGMSQAQLSRFMTTGRGISIETLDRLGAALGLRLVVDADE